MEYYYVSEDDVNLKDKTLIVKGEEYKHLSKILGKKIGEEITFTDGKGTIYESIVVHISKTLIECHIININKVINDTELKLILICSPLKNPSRFEFSRELVHFHKLWINPRDYDQCQKNADEPIYELG